MLWTIYSVISDPRMDTFNKSGVETLISLSKPPQHVHQNFTTWGILLNYVIGFIAFSVVSRVLTLCYFIWALLRRDNFSISNFLISNLVREVLIKSPDLPLLLRYPLVILQTRSEACEHVRLHCEIGEGSSCCDGYSGGSSHHAHHIGVPQGSVLGG